VCARARALNDLYDKRGFFVQRFQSLPRRGFSYIFLEIQGIGRMIIQNYILHEY